MGARSVSERRAAGRRRTPRRRRGRVDNDGRSLARRGAMVEDRGPLVGPRSGSGRRAAGRTPRRRRSRVDKDRRSLAERGGMVEDRGPVVGARSGSGRRAAGRTSRRRRSRVHKDGRSLAERGGVVQDRRSLVESLPWCAGLRWPDHRSSRAGSGRPPGRKRRPPGPMDGPGLRLGGHGRQSSLHLATRV